jgi:uncharacterized protein YjbJ (UPF0337 family)
MKNTLNHLCTKKGVGLFIVLGLLIVAPAWAGTVPGISIQEPSMHPYLFKVYNQDQFEGNWKQLKGALKENWGEFTEDDLLAIDGRTDRFEGKLQERYGERKEEVKEWVDKWLENHPYETEEPKVRR